jgi:hypothetical protein
MFPLKPWSIYGLKKNFLLQDNPFALWYFKTPAPPHFIQGFKVPLVLFLYFPEDGDVTFIFFLRYHPDLVLPNAGKEFFCFPPLNIVGCVPGYILGA